MVTWVMMGSTLCCCRKNQVAQKPPTEEDRKDPGEKLKHYGWTLTASCTSVDAEQNDEECNREASSTSSLDDTSQGVSSLINENSTEVALVTTVERREGLNPQAIHNENATESDERGVYASSPDVSKEDKSLADENFPYSGNVIYVREFDDESYKNKSTCSRRCDGICDENIVENGYEGGTCSSDEDQDKMPANETVLAEGVPDDKTIAMVKTSNGNSDDNKWPHQSDEVIRDVDTDDNDELTGSPAGGHAYQDHAKTQVRLSLGNVDSGNVFNKSGGVISSSPTARNDDDGGNKIASINPCDSDEDGDHRVKVSSHDSSLDYAEGGDTFLPGRSDASSGAASFPAVGNKIAVGDVGCDSTNTEKENSRDINDDKKFASFAVNYSEDNKDPPVFVKRSHHSDEVVRDIDIYDQNESEDSGSRGHVYQDHIKTSVQFPFNDIDNNNVLDGSGRFDVTSSSPAARSDDDKGDESDSINSCDSEVHGVYGVNTSLGCGGDTLLPGRSDASFGAVSFSASRDDTVGSDVSNDAGDADAFRNNGFTLIEEENNDDAFYVKDEKSYTTDQDDAEGDHDPEDDGATQCQPKMATGRPEKKSYALDVEHDQLNGDDDPDAPCMQRTSKTSPGKKTSREFPFSVDVDVMEYTHSSKHRETFNNFLEDKGIIFTWSQGDDLAQINCSGDETKSVKALNSFINDFKTHDFAIEHVFWHCVVADVSNIQFALGDIPPLVKILEDQKKLRIVSFKSSIDSHKSCLEKELKRIKKEAPFGCETISNCSKDHILLLKKINFIEKYLVKECKDLKVIFDEENAVIRLEGPPLQLKTAMQRFREQEITTDEKPLKLPERSLEYLMTEYGQEAIQKELELHGIEAIVLFDPPFSNKPLSARVRGYASEAILRIRDIVSEKEITVEESNVPLTKTPDWLMLCEKIELSQGVLIRMNDSGITWITGVQENVLAAAEMMQLYIDKNSIKDEEYVFPSSDIKKYIVNYCMEELDKMTADLEEYDVRLSLPNDEEQTIYISGRMKGLEKTKEFFDDLVKRLVVRRLERKQPGLRKHFETGGIGQRLMKSIEDDQKCLINVDKDFHHNGDRHCYLTTAQGHAISWKIGDITKEQVHAVVVPQGTCTEALINSIPGEAARPLGEIKAGGISAFSTRSVNLPFSHVVFTSCSSWNEGSGEKCLRSIVRNSFQEVEQTKGTSIAFPAIGTGKLKFPYKEAARIMLGEAVKFCTENPTSWLKDIRFVLLSGDQMVIEAFSQEAVNPENHLLQASGEMWFENVNIVQGDLVKEFQSEAVLNVIRNDINISRAGSLSERVVRSAGNRVEQELRQLIEKSNRPKALITSGGNLSASRIIHIIPSSSDEKEIKKSLEKGLQLAKQNNIRSISLPAVGTGGYNLSASASARIIFQALKSVWSGNCPNFPVVRIVILQSSEMINSFKSEKQKHTASVNSSRSNCKTKMGSISIEVVAGDLTCEETDAIVNIVNADMNMENAGELSKEIAKACGPQVRDECMQMGPQPVGTAVITSGGKLNAPHIIHLIPGSSDVNHLQLCLEKCLSLAESKRLHSISLPAIGTGGYAMSSVMSAKMIFWALASFSRTCLRIRKVRVVIKQEPILEAFKQEQKKHEGTSYAVASTKPTNCTVRVTVMGKDKGNVYKAIAALKDDFSGIDTYDELKDEGIRYFSESQINSLLREAESCDIEMTVDSARCSIALRGNKDKVHSMVKKVHEKLSKARECEKKRQQEENVRMISKTVEWTYKFQEQNISFDLKTNLEIEMAHSRGDQNVAVTSQGGHFDIDLSHEPYRGYKQPEKEQIVVKRRLKQVEEIPLPEHWDEIPDSTKDVFPVALSKDSDEYSEVSTKFSTTAKNAVITRIERVQNPFRYRSYMLRKQKMDKDNGRNNERQLFHGTSADVTMSINTQGFNRNFCGKNGTLYGKGVYFANTASYSQQYTNHDDVGRCMYLARVLVGNYCIGNKDMKAPPPKDPKRPEILYDSTVDKTVNPTIFVAFSDDQCYPEYLIYFHSTATT